jgi:hypothetical protein
MSKKLSFRQRIVCCAVALSCAVIYVGFYYYTIGQEWAAKEGDRPPIPHWFDILSSDLTLFPFGFMPAIRGINSFVLNIIFWSGVGVVCYLLFCRRKAVADRARSGH